jgi:hypothetical protein
MNCPSCKSEVVGGSRFCPACGAALDLDSVPRTQPYREEIASSSDSGAHGRFLPGTVLARRYRIVGLLGQGGMGEVYRADDLKLGQAVALKFLPERLADDPRRLECFHNEVRLARQVSHPNVCRVYDIGEVDGQHFLSMEYVDGEDLAACFVVNSLSMLPITADSSAWYFGSSLFALTAVVGLGVYGFFTSLSGQPLLGSRPALN